MARRHRDEELDSEFEFALEKRRKTWRDDPLSAQKPTDGHGVPSHSAAVPSKELVTQERDKEEWRARRFHLLSMDAYSRHKALVNQYLLVYGQGIEHVQRPTDTDRNDYSILREQHRFLWDDGDEASTWEKRLAKTYYDKLFKEYAISDLSHYKENKVAMRWRTEKEVVEGKGQFVCGSKHCLEREDLKSWEVNFAYVEQGERKNALVKLRLCPKCSKKLNYHRRKEEKHKRREERKHRRKDKGKRGERLGKSSLHRISEERSKTRKGEESSTDSSGEEGSGAEAEGGKDKGAAVWSKPAEVLLERSKEEEFDDYFKDMLL